MTLESCDSLGNRPSNRPVVSFMNGPVAEFWKNMPPGSRPVAFTVSTTVVSHVLCEIETTRGRFKASPARVTYLGHRDP